MPIIKRRLRGITIDVPSLLSVFWKRKWIILLSGVAAALITYVWILLFVTPEYATSVTLYANNAKSTDMNTTISSAELSASARLVDTYAAIILSDPVLEQVINDNNLNMTTSNLAKRITISAVNSTEVFKVRVIYPEPKVAANIANSIADIAPGVIGGIVDGCSIKLVSYAKVPVKKASPKYQEDVEKGFWTGIVLSAVVIFLIAALDTRVKSEADLNEWEKPVLGIIPLFEEAERTGMYGYRKREHSKNEHIQ